MIKLKTENFFERKLNKIETYWEIIQAYTLSSIALQEVEEQNIKIINQEWENFIEGKPHKLKILTNLMLKKINKALGSYETLMQKEPERTIEVEDLKNIVLISDYALETEK